MSGLATALPSGVEQLCKRFGAGFDAFSGRWRANGTRRSSGVGARRFTIAEHSEACGQASHSRTQAFDLTRGVAQEGEKGLFRDGGGSAAEELDRRGNYPGNVIERVRDFAGRRRLPHRFPGSMD
jgi:hypothetical protein